jgi:hypothetical protein
MTSTQQFFKLRGGLDQETPALEIPPGRVIAAINHEATALGYQRTEGFERYDGQPSPSAAEFFTADYTSGRNVQFAAGQIVTGLTSGATARVLAAPVVSSGAIATHDQVGSLPLHLVTGTFEVGEWLMVGSSKRGLVSTLPTLGDFREGEQEAAWYSAAVEYARGLIAAVPGSGGVRGVVWYGDKLNAWRDNADASAGVLYHSSAAGWAASDLGKQVYIANGGPYEIVPGDIIIGDQSGATATVRYVGIDNGSFPTSDANGLLILDNIVGNFGDETITVTNHVGIATISAAPAAVTFPPGGRYEFDIFNFYATDTFERCYGANGVSKAFEFDGDTVAFISTGMTVDKPHLVKEHKEHLFLAFDAGSLQHSSLGTPRDFSGNLGAAELGMGHDITNIIPNTAAVMLIFTDQTLSSLTGNDSSDWLLEPVATRDAGAKPFTAQQITNVIYLDNRGVRSAASTQTLANFRLGSYTTLINKELARKRAAGIEPVASCVVKAKDQYLLFFDDGSGISIWFGAKQPEALLFQYPFVVSCSPCVVEIDGLERIFVGAEDGFIYELNKGTSFDGAEIDAFIQLPFGHQGAPRVLKRYNKLELELVAQPGTLLGVIPQFSHGSVEQPLVSQYDLDGGGGLWDTVNWGEFIWSAPPVSNAEFWIDGSGFDMSPIFVSRQADVPSYTIAGLTVVFSGRGRKR